MHSKHLKKVSQYIVLYNVIHPKASLKVTCKSPNVLHYIWLQHVIS